MPHLNKYLLGRNTLSGDLASFIPFGNDPLTFTGADFFDGSSAQGMLVFKTAKTYDAFTPIMAGDVEVLVVAAGGKGGAGTSNTRGGGGGGAGGYLYNAAFAISKLSTTVTVGNIGAANGGNSVFSTLTAIGGGLGAVSIAGEPPGADGGSGGGGGAGPSGSTYLPGGTGTVGPPRQGYDAGNGAAAESGNRPGGGGGGASSAGANGVVGATTTAGGLGIEYFGFTYAAGGSSKTASGAGANMTANTGNGGGGGGESSAGGDGGTGIVIIRWGGYTKNYNATTNAVT